jgi:hypothetical protein
MQPGVWFALDLLRVTNVMQQVKCMAAMAMQSYSDPWTTNSTVQVNITVDHHHRTSKEVNSTAGSLSQHDAAHSFSGYHNQKTFFLVAQQPFGHTIRRPVFWSSSLYLSLFLSHIL